MDKQIKVAIFIAFVGIAISIVILAVGQTNTEVSAKKLADQGYTQISYAGYDLFNCGKTDWYAHRFNAEKSGKKHVLTVCTSPFGASTIRIVE